eukprot:CAMPEP_0206237988 /NCGR_PEP_ID=MMETSP0047_2-20121206/14567_1 /ASSEMBLY_ACC=CAM_ASM_000192 /TAXON_ID=195065 /ORGANISM="Chroomonas mesostigmatica_cf, Strain CCMP1168" /LENGTH=62 /DNA_ID=CAMNT_0053662477 /DNA_START=60 /DNA_END=245 /DNA_ORIENTATION=-
MIPMWIVNVIGGEAQCLQPLAEHLVMHVGPAVGWRQQVAKAPVIPDSSGVEVPGYVDVFTPP